MSDILNNNLAALQERFPDIHSACAERLKKYGPEGSFGNVYADTSVNGEFIVAVNRRNRLWYLNSRYHATAFLKDWWKGATSTEDGKVHYKATMILCGIGNGDSVNYALKQLGEENILVIFEPDPDVFMCLISNRDITGIIRNPRVALYVNDINMGTFRQSFTRMLSFTVIKNTLIATSFGYMGVYREEIDEFVEVCRQEIRRAYGEQNTVADYGDEMAENAISNQWMIAKSSTINQLKAYLEEQKVDRDNIPVIIVSAGPSLEKNIEDLKLAKGKALIIAVDSAIRKMLTHDIIPDMVMTVDSHKPMVLFADERAKLVPMIFCGQSRKDIVSEHHGKTFSFASETFSYTVFNSAGKPMDTLFAGGSVANEVFSLAEYLGFKKIILVGQDLAFTDNRKHAQGTYDESKVGEDDEEKYTYVEDIYGNQVLTFENFRIYKEWFEGRIADNKELTVIDATEGGAKIQGAAVMTLKEAVKKYCNTDFDAGLLEQVSYMMNDEELTEYYEYLNSLIERCKALRKMFYQGIDAYDKIKMLIKRGQTGNSEFRKASEIIAKVTGMDTTEPILSLVSLYSAKAERELLDNMYDEDDSIKAAIAAANHGTELLKIYIEALEKIQSNFDRLIRFEVSKDMYEVTEYTLSFK
ncbi:MAG: motility associated factor glycosyltransferase family protein [Lachnospira sp.]|nr:motility associated factor glycosyltransferase family protein [Lachnospira sp.]